MGALVPPSRGARPSRHDADERRSRRPVARARSCRQGTVAQLLSDQMWFWARGFEGGGPEAELLRRLAYWLMKEPDLEENDLRAAVEGDRLAVTRQSLEPD